MYETHVHISHHRRKPREQFDVITYRRRIEAKASSRNETGFFELHYYYYYYFVDEILSQARHPGSDNPHSGAPIASLARLRRPGDAVANAIVECINYKWTKVRLVHRSRWFEKSLYQL